MCVQVVYHSHQELNRFKPHKKYYWLFSLPGLAGVNVVLSRIGMLQVRLRSLLVS